VKPRPGSTARAVSLVPGDRVSVTYSATVASQSNPYAFPPIPEDVIKLVRENGDVVFESKKSSFRIEEAVSRAPVWNPGTIVAGNGGLLYVVVLTHNGKMMVRVNQLGPAGIDFLPQPLDEWFNEHTNCRVIYPPDNGAS
jgi:hypothetical protein